MYFMTSFIASLRSASTDHLTAVENVDTVATVNIITMKTNTVDADGVKRSVMVDDLSLRSKKYSSEIETLDEWSKLELIA